MKREKQADAEELCRDFRRIAMHIWGTSRSATMDLPYIYNDGDLARIRVDVMDNGKLLVSDDGGAARHEELTIEEVKNVCRRYGLRYETIDDDLTMPLCCDMYCVVDKKDFYLAVWHVIRAIHDAHDMVEEKMAEEKKEVKS